MRNPFVTLFILLIAVAFNCTAQDQAEHKVPSAAKDKLAAMYPSATNIKWEKEGDSFEAELKDHEKNLSVAFDASGNYLQTETEVAISTLPAAIKQYAEGRHAGHPIKEASQIVDASGTVTYEAEIDGEDYLFDKNGNYIGVEDESGDDDGDDDED